MQSSGTRCLRVLWVVNEGVVLFVVDEEVYRKNHVVSFWVSYVQVS